MTLHCCLIHSWKLVGQPSETPHVFALQPFILIQELRHLLLCKAAGPQQKLRTSWPRIDGKTHGFRVNKMWKKTVKSSKIIHTQLVFSVPMNIQSDQVCSEKAPITIHQTLAQRLPAGSVLGAFSMFGTITGTVDIIELFVLFIQNIEQNIWTCFIICFTIYPFKYKVCPLFIYHLNIER